MRNTGIHACGVIITPSDITNYVPVTTAKILIYMLLSLITRLQKVLGLKDGLLKAGKIPYWYSVRSDAFPLMM
jgi:hypothetical protein